jgi:Uma2 family endonuclease
MASQPSTFITPEEYLALERVATTRSEYYSGEMFAMAGASRAHNLIVTNLVRELSNRLRARNCEVYSNDMRLMVNANVFTYPDVMVICGSPNLTDQAGDALTNPSLVIEVLSESTKDYDRGGKLHHYMRIASLKEYLTVSQSEMLVDYSVRQTDGGWLLREIGPESGVVPISSLEIELHFADIYEKVFS